MRYPERLRGDFGPRFLDFTRIFFEMVRISGGLRGHDAGESVLADITHPGSFCRAGTGASGGEIQKMCSNEHFLFDVSDSERFCGRHERDITPQDTLVLEERSGGIPWPDGQGAGGIFTVTGMV
jgi:hypothetical protein